MAGYRINLNQIFLAMENKDRDFYDRLDDAAKKEFSGYKMMRYCSAISNCDAETVGYYICSTNHYANKHMFSLSKHPKLQWLMLTSATVGITNARHNWIKQKPKSKNIKVSIKKQLMELYPLMKEDDAAVLSTLITKKELNEYIKAHGES